LRIAILSTDGREPERTYDVPVPWFGAGHFSLMQGLALCPDVEVHVISCTQRPMRSPEKLADNIWFHSLHVPKIGWLRTLYQGCIRASRRKIRALDPDVVHGQGTERDCSIAAALSGYPNLVTIAGNMAELSRQQRPRIGSYLWLAGRLENYTLRRTDGVFCNSRYTEALVRPRTKRTWLVPHAIRLAFLDAPLPAPPPSCVLLNAGVISPRKRQLEVLDIAEALHQRGIHCEFRFIGYVKGDSYGRRFLERIQSMQALGSARFLGPQPDGELVKCYDDASGVLHFPTEESFGNVVIEAMSRNLKVFASRVGGIIDTTQGIAGAELFEPTDWHGLCESITRWVRSGHPRLRQAAEVIRDRYHPRAIARRHIDIYRDLASTLS
jgi:glycosyltransferase involved in cell wall biosynthesis